MAPAAVWAAVKIGGMPSGRMDATCMQRTRNNSVMHGADVQMAAQTHCAQPYRNACTCASGAGSHTARSGVRPTLTGPHRRPHLQGQSAAGAGDAAEAEAVPGSETYQLKMIPLRMRPVSQLSGGQLSPAAVRQATRE